MTSGQKGDLPMSTAETIQTPPRVKDWPTVAAKVPPEVHLAAKQRAAEEGRTLSVLVEAALRAYLVGKGRRHD
mgnify:CR=1 FL=1